LRQSQRRKKTLTPWLYVWECGGKKYIIRKKMSGDIGIRGGHKKSLFEQNDGGWS